LVDLEGVKLAGAVAIHSLTDAGNKVSKLGLVIFRDHRASYSSLRLARHEYETTLGVRPRRVRTPWRIVFPPKR
jgi:hypothetical protein